MIAWRAILTGAATRFVPGVLTFFGASFLVAAALKGIEIGPQQIFGFTALGLSMTAGYVLTLGLMRPSLEASAGIKERRSYVAGLGATCVLLGLGVLHGSPTGLTTMSALSVLAGSITTGLTFFPWLMRRKGEEQGLAEDLAASYPQYFAPLAPHTVLDIAHKDRDRVV